MDEILEMLMVSKTEGLRNSTFFQLGTHYCTDFGETYSQHEKGDEVYFDVFALAISQVLGSAKSQQDIVMIKEFDTMHLLADFMVFHELFKIYEDDFMRFGELLVSERHTQEEFNDELEKFDIEKFSEDVHQVKVDTEYPYLDDEDDEDDEDEDLDGFDQFLNMMEELAKEIGVDMEEESEEESEEK